MSLVELLEEVKIDIRSFDAFERKFTVREAFKHFTWLTTATEENPQVLKAAILKIPLPTIYVHERESGTTFDVLMGDEIIETLRRFVERSEHLDTGSDEFMLARRIMNTELHVVRFRPCMTWDDVQTVMGFIKGIV